MIFLTIRIQEMLRCLKFLKKSMFEITSYIIISIKNLKFDQQHYGKCDLFIILISRTIGAIMDLEYKKLIQNFRISIRRRQIDQIFETKRQEYLKQQQDEYRQRLYEKLHTSSERQQWVHQMALKLADLPNPQWSPILKNLYYAVGIYENDHQFWVRNGIINSICDALKPQFRHLNYMKIVSNILTDIFSLNSKEMHHQKIIKQLMNIKFVEEIASLMIQTEEIEYIKLMGMLFNSVSNMRNYFIDLGCLNFIINRFSKIDQGHQPSSEYMYSLLFMVYGMLKVHQFDKHTFCKPKRSTILILIPILNKQIQKKHPINNLGILLRSIRQICMTGEQQMYDQILKHQSLIGIALQMLCHQSRPQIRLISARTLSYFLMTKNRDHIRYIMSQGILNQINSAYRLPGNQDSTRQTYLSILSNITADIEQFQQAVLNHSVMTEIIIPQAQDSYCPEIRRQAVYCICNILQKMDKGWVYKLFNELKIFDSLVNNIKRSDRDIQTVKDILQTWKNMIIDCSKKISSNEQNFIFRVLKNYYGIQDILCQLNQSDELHQQIMVFLDFFNNYDE